MESRTPQNRLTERPKGARLLESVVSFYSKTGRDIATDGCDSARRNRLLHATARFCVTSSRLSHDSSADLLPGSKPRRSGDNRNCSSGTTVRPATRAEPNDLQQLRRQLCSCAAVQLKSQHRYRGRRSTVGD